MPSTIFQIKRRTSGQTGISGVALYPGELAYNEVDQKLYYGYLDSRITNWRGQYDNGVTYSAGDGVSYSGVNYVMTDFIAAGYVPSDYPANWDVASTSPQAVAGPGKLLSREINQNIVGSKTFTGVVDFTAASSLVAVTPPVSTVDSSVATTEFVQNVFSYLDGGSFDGEGGYNPPGSGAAVFMTSTSQSNDWYDLANWQDVNHTASGSLPISSSQVIYTGTHTVINIDDYRWVNPAIICVASSAVLGVSSGLGTVFTSVISGAGTVNYLGNVDVSMSPNVGGGNQGGGEGVVYIGTASSQWNDLSGWVDSSFVAANALPGSSAEVTISGCFVWANLDDPSWIAPASVLLVRKDPNSVATLGITSNNNAVWDLMTTPVSSTPENGGERIVVSGNATLLFN